ncbi:hypothetical protein [Armatimonas rosea]|uniref:Uncharacterized protein n=1 Tax=Armatimonas rosea TaxID=685828 RepID=A0A7W9SMR4_ARMRO|nr:hypothetical protein [Armatimonas rosea]MBB6049029.1 hypothetical protein [Armatimonas rosea]
MSSQLFEEEAPSVAAPKNGRSARTAPAPKPEIALTDPFADEPEVAVAEVLQSPEPPLEVEVEAVAAVVDVEPAPAPAPVVVPAPAPPAPVVVAPAPVVVAATAPAGPRALPEERQSLTLTLKAGGCEGLVIVGLYDDGKPGEVLLLLRNAPAGAAAALEAFASTLTLALPYGVPAGVLATQLLALVSEPSAHEAARTIAHSLSTRF